MGTNSFSSAVVALVLMAIAAKVDPSAAFSQESPSSSRRAFFRKSFEFATLAGSSSIILQQPQPSNAAIKTGASNPFTGDYDDPNHPGCLRQVKVVGAPLGGNGVRSNLPVIEITGWDGDDGGVCKTRPKNREVLWQIPGRIKSTDTAVIDFSLKGGPSDLLAKYENGAIVFPDGNKWKKIPEQSDRRPKNMRTLSSGPQSRERDDD